METVRWGILGLGTIAERFAAALPSSRTGVLAAVGSRDGDRARSFAERFGADRGIGGYDELLADDGVDAVYVATPHPMHAQWAIRAMAAGKHVLCEKPLTLNHAEAMAVVEAAREHDVFLTEAYLYRCHPQTARLVEMLRSGAVGQVHQLQAAFAFRSSAGPTDRLFRQDLGGGGILDVGGYPVSMVRLLAGAARGEPFADPDRVDGVARLGADNRIDEWAAASLRFDATADQPAIDAHVTSGVGLAAESVVRVVGSDGYLVVHSPWGARDDRPLRVDVHRAGAEPETLEIPTPGPLFAVVADEVAAHLSERQSPAMTWADTLGNMATLDRWRTAVGLTYDAERPDADIPPVHGRRVSARPGNRMRYAEVGPLTTPVSRLVLGSVGSSLPHASVMFDDFVERGGNCFDTGYIYGGGASERLLGQWMRNRGNRDEVVVIGKGAHTPHCDPESITRQLGETLERLQTDHVDLYFMHRDNLDFDVSEFVDVLDEHRRAGRIRAYGGSNWTLERVEAANAYAAANGRAPFVALSNNFSLARMVQAPWDGCLSASDPVSRAWLEKEQMPLFPWSSQAQGFFTTPPSGTPTSPFDRCWRSEGNLERKARALQLAERLGVSAVAVALAYVLAQRFPAFPLVGPRQLTETRDSFAALDIELSPDQVDWLDLRDRD